MKSFELQGKTIWLESENSGHDEKQDGRQRKQISKGKNYKEINAKKEEKQTR